MNTTTMLTDTAAIRAYIRGGQAIFTVVSPKTGTRFTYRVRRANQAHRYFVDVLTGPENSRDYTFIGSMTGHYFRHSLKSALPDAAPAVIGFDWLMSRIDYPRPLDPAKVEFWTSGRCSRCGRILTTPESIATGMGPVCQARTTL